jgi:glycine cleavage system pyridoxal-binding protein P
MEQKGPSQVALYCRHDLFIDELEFVALPFLTTPVPRICADCAVCVLTFFGFETSFGGLTCAHDNAASLGS